MLAVKRLISLSWIWAAAIAVVIGGPLHLAVIHGPASQHHAHHDHAHEATCHHDAQPTDSEQQPRDDSSHSCSLCVLLSFGGTLPALSVALAEGTIYSPVCCAGPTRGSAGDQQLPSARAPPVRAI